MPKVILCSTNPYLINGFKIWYNSYKISHDLIVTNKLEFLASEKKLNEVIIFLDADQALRIPSYLDILRENSILIFDGCNLDRYGKIANWRFLNIFDSKLPMAEFYRLFALSTYDVEQKGKSINEYKLINRIPEVRNKIRKLTQRELEVAELLYLAYSKAEITRITGLSFTRVVAIIRSIYSKIDATKYWEFLKFYENNIAPEKTLKYIPEKNSSMVA